MPLSIDPLRPYLPLIYGGIVVLVVAGFAVQRLTINRLRDQVASRNAELKGFREAQRTNMLTIGKLQTTLSAVVEAMRADRERAIAAVTAAEKRAVSINNELELTREELQRVYAKSPSARKWGDTGVDADVAGSLPGRRRPN